MDYNMKTYLDDAFNANNFDLIPKLLPTQI